MMAFDIIKIIGGMNPFKKKTVSPAGGSYAPGASAPSAGSYDSAYPSQPQYPSQPPYASQNYPSQYPPPYPTQAYPPSQAYASPYPSQPQDDAIRTKLNLVLSEIDTLKAQLQALNEKLSLVEEYLKQPRMR